MIASSFFVPWHELIVFIDELSASGFSRDGDGRIVVSIEDCGSFDASSILARRPFFFWRCSYGC